jgi:DNA-binding transcriptional LysR family regulator
MPTRLAQLRRISHHQLRAFEAAARLLSVTGAARELHLTQPTVSVQLRELAAVVGEPLFETAGRRLRLTQAGELLQQAVAELGACWERFDARLAELHGLVRGKLRIGAVTTAEYFVPDLIGPFAAAHPGVEIELIVENRDRVVQRLARGEDELSVMMLPPEDPPLQRVAFLDNPLVVIAPPAHPLAALRRVPLARLAQERWLLREPGSGTRTVAQAHFERAGFVPRAVMSLGSNEAIKHAVAAGLGVAVISQLAVADWLQARRPPVALLPVTGFPILRKWSVVWRRDQPLSAAARQFVGYLQRAPQPAPRG